MKPHIWYVKNVNWWIIGNKSKTYFIAVGRTPLEAYDAWKICFGK